MIVMKQFTMRTWRKRVINVPFLLEELLNLTLTESENIKSQMLSCQFCDYKLKKKEHVKHIKPSIAGKKAERAEH